MEQIKLIIGAILVCMYLWGCESKTDEVTPSTNTPITSVIDSSNTATNGCGEITFYSSDSCKMSEFNLINSVIFRTISYWDDLNYVWFPYAVNGDTALDMIDINERNDTIFSVQEYTFPNGITQKIPYMGWKWGSCGIGFDNWHTINDIRQISRLHCKGIIFYADRFIQIDNDPASNKFNSNFGFEFDTVDQTFLSNTLEFTVKHYDLDQPIQSYEITYRRGTYSRNLNIITFIY